MVSLLFSSAVICGVKGPCEHRTVWTVTKSLGSAFIRCFWGAHNDPMDCKCLPLPVLELNHHSLLEAFHFDVLDPTIS